MTFWLMVGLLYLAILGAGLALGHYLGSRRDRRGGGGLDLGPAPTPPPAPTHGVEWLPLGSAFDRALLPGAFDPIAVDVVSVPQRA